MNKKRVAGMIAVAIVCGGIVIAGNLLEKQEQGSITNQDGKEIASLYLEDGKLQYDCDPKYASYADIVCQEALEVFASDQGVDQEEAGKMIVKNGLKIETFLKEDVLDSVYEAYDEQQVVMAKKCGIAVSDTEGHLLACLSESSDSNQYNNVTMPTFAGSTMKPVSVYAPAIEKGMISWSSQVEDSAYTTIKNEVGEMEEWPQNTEPFTHHMLTIADALKDSNNAIAVKVLKEYGVENSMRFIRDTFGYNVDNEEKNLDEKGEDAILGNIALGYLENGVTVKQMVSTYQIFANGGKYTPVYTIKQITKGNDVVWKSEPETKQVLSEETAYIMNRMLRQVVTEGTGAAAQLDEIDICGKTGTSEYGDHWFVGFTPEVVCSIWCKSSDEQNNVTSEATHLCGEIIQKVVPEKNKTFDKPSSIQEVEYCETSGLIANELCNKKKTGYYSIENIPSQCGECK